MDSFSGIGPDNLYEPSGVPDNKPSRFNQKTKLYLKGMLMVAVLSLVTVGTVFYAKSSQKYTNQSQAAESTQPINYQSETVVVSQINTPTVIKATYTNPSGWKNLREMMIWADNFSPRGFRLNYSLHGKLVRQNDGTFKLFGEKLNPNSKIICGSDIDYHHCYRNFSWDVGGFPLTSGTSSPVYMNHDSELRDTISPTENSVGSVRVAGVKEISPASVEISWELNPGKFFNDRILDVYVNGINESNIQIYGDNPQFRTIKRLYVYDNDPKWLDYSRLPKQISYFSLDNQPDIDRFKKTGVNSISTLDTLRKFNGSASVRIDKASQIEYDNQTLITGIVTAYFYDDPKNTANGFYLAVSTAPEAGWNQSTTHTIVLGVDPRISAANYIYKARVETIAASGSTPAGTNISSSDNFRYYDTKIVRTPGWHKVSFWVTEYGSWAEIEDAGNLLPLANMTALQPVVDSGKNMTRLSYDREMTSFRYLRIGNWLPASTFNADEISISTVPPALVRDVNTLNSYEGALRWENYFAATWLDMYEETAFWGNMERISEKNSQYNPAGSSEWWWYSLADAAFASDLRFKSTGLPFYKNQARNIMKHLMDNNNKWAGNDWVGRMAGGSVYMTMTTLLWNDLTPDLQSVLRQYYQDFMSSLEVSVGNNYIGDSAAENSAYATSVPITAAILFNDHPQAKDWASLGLRIAAQSISSDKNANGVKNIYGLNQQLADCTQSNLSSPDCFCPGDRATLPGNRDFSYLMDNHDFNPHPGYMSGAVDGVLNAPFTAKVFDSYGKKPDFIPVDYNLYSKDLFPMWSRMVTFFDYTKDLFFSENIYRVRSKGNCGRPPYTKAENPFLVTGQDDWGNPASVTTLNTNALLKAKYVFSVNSFKDGTGKTFDLDTLTKKTSALAFWQHYNYFTKQLSPNVYITDAEVNGYGHNSNSSIYIMNRLNSLMAKMFRIGLIDPGLPIPLSGNIAGPINCASFTNIWINSCNNYAKYSSAPKDPGCVTTSDNVTVTNNVTNATFVRYQLVPAAVYCTDSSINWTAPWLTYSKETRPGFTLSSGDNKICAQFKNSTTTVSCGGTIFK